MKKLIYQVKIGSSSLYEWCTESVKKYADIIGADYIQQTKPILKILPKNRTESNRSDKVFERGYLPIFEKENAFDLFPRYDQMAIIDADIFIKTSAPNIFRELPEEYDFGAVLEYEMPITDKYRQKIKSYSNGQYKSIANWTSDPSYGFPFWNMGVMILNSSFQEYLNGMAAKEFIEQPNFKDFVDGKGNWKWSTDQTLLNWWIREQKMKTKNLDWRYNALYKGIRDDKLKEAHFVHFFLSDHHVKDFNKTKLEKEIF
jgi:lipopolysaccharide biosynthesis glycosyltransferase